MLVKWILKESDNQKLSPSWFEHTVFDDRVSNMILDFFNHVDWEVEIVVSQWRITVRQIRED